MILAGCGTDPLRFFIVVSVSALSRVPHGRTAAGGFGEGRGTSGDRPHYDGIKSLNLIERLIG